MKLLRQINGIDLRPHFDIQNLISFGDDLINLLNSKNGFDVVSQSFDHSEALHFACDEDLNRIQESIKDCKKKLEAYKKKADEAYSDVSARDDEIERLQRELDEDMELERKINAERRVVADELKDLKAQWASIDEKRQSLKRKERRSFLCMRVSQRLYQKQTLMIHSRSQAIW
ncbi:PREDICTED: uncharacterized protein LOC106330179 [Brassica oleracea var. oleracea]|uniref:uncharacterized protein LOC106330179 n=1 Tax=Brassica oleracea var. oleracea TaxID=109376 RepID=UPI0006A6D939|nr:PREDICTED: uncharacterized protein LOC106330179 [Brassica oleracea var. oleracea]